MSRIVPRAVALFMCTMLTRGVAVAQTPAFPAKPIRMVVTAAPGGITDIIARLMGEHFQRTVGQPMIIDNKPGAGGNIGSEIVVKSPPDGYSLVIINVGTAAIHRWLYKNMPFNPLTDLVPVAPVVDGASIVAVPTKLGPKTLSELIDLARASPNKLNYGSAGIGTMPHLSAELFAYMTGTQLEHVPYKGAAPAAVDLAAGEIQIAFIALGSMRAQIAAGQVRALAVGSKDRLAAIPDVPTFAEAGLPGYDVTNWFGVFAPRGTPREVVAFINTQIGRMFDDPAILKRITEGGMVPMRESPEAFAKRVADDDSKWRDVVKRAGITPQ